MRSDRGTLRLAPWLLFAATAIGLIAMHSLGHGGGPAFHAPPAHSAAYATGMATPMLVEADDCAGDGCLHAAGTPGHGGHHMANTSVCQGLVEALGVLLLIGLLLLAAAGHPRPSTSTGFGQPAAARAPPPPSIGLALSTVSVLRI